MNNGAVHSLIPQLTGPRKERPLDAEQRAALHRALHAPAIRKRRALQLSQRLLQAADRLAEIGPRRILEVGCGHGILLSELSRRMPDAELIGLDRSESMILRAQRRNAIAMASGKVAIVETDLESYVHQGPVVDAIVTVNYGPLGAPEEVGQSIWPAAQCLDRGGVWVDIFDSPISESVERHLVHSLRIFSEAGLSPTVRSLTTQRIEIHARFPQ